MDLDFRSESLDVLTVLITSDTTLEGALNGSLMMKLCSFGFLLTSLCMISRIFLVVAF
jgi:hypothetical protein